MKKSSEQILKELAAPFEEIAPDGSKVPALKWFAKTTQNGNGLFFPYITANQVANRLNEVMGIDGWSNTQTETTGNSYLITDITLNIGDKEISRSDVGTPANFEKEKSMASDGIKRAARLFGIGAYIKDIPSVEIEVNGGLKKGFVVTDKKQEISILDKEAVNSYINTKSPHRASLTKIYKAIPKPKRAEFDDVFKKIFDII